MKITKSIIRSLLAGGLVAVLVAILVPRRLTFLELMVCLFAVVGLFELVKADMRSDICARIRTDIQREHMNTRVWLRDWFDYEQSHCVTSIPYDPNHLHPLVAFEQRYGIKKAKTSEKGKDDEGGKA